MQWSANLHTHSPFDDGEALLEAFVQAALAQGLHTLGFSPHGPLPFHNDWVLNADKVPAYKEELLRLKKKYQGQLELYCGLEADFIPAKINPVAQKAQYQFDYVIGSVHYLDPLPTGKLWAVDASLNEFETGLAALFKGKIRDAVSRYYTVLREMIANYPPDIIGHLDLIKMHNGHQRYFSEQEDWYREEIEQTLAVVRRSPCVVEVNTGGLARGRATDFYPSPWIIEKCLALNIPLTINSDAHRPSQLTGYFPEALACLARLQCRELVIWTATGWQTITLED